MANGRRPTVDSEGPTGAGVSTIGGGEGVGGGGGASDGTMNSTCSPAIQYIIRGAVDGAEA